MCAPPAATAMGTPPSRTAASRGPVTGLALVPRPTCPEAFAPQHRSAPPSTSAHACELPAATAATEPPSAPASFEPTTTGVFESVVVPLPSWPLALLPAHESVPFGSAEHVKAPPAARSVVYAAPKRAGFAVVVFAALPSWPYVFEPQHSAPASTPAANAHECRPPTSTADASGRLATVVGVPFAPGVVVPSSSLPLSPQQRTWLSVWCAHACAPPTETPSAIATPTTGAGVDATMREPLPTRPLTFAPQHTTLPSCLRAHAVDEPATTCTAPASDITAADGAFSDAGVALPMPS